eukprot:5744521-Pleurochrysis_carterae.AAC.1
MEHEAVERRRGDLARESDEAVRRIQPREEARAMRRQTAVVYRGLMPIVYAFAYHARRRWDAHKSIQMGRKSDRSSELAEVVVCNTCAEAEGHVRGCESGMRRDGS